MSNQEPDTTVEEPSQSTRPRNPDGTFMSKSQIEKLDKKVTDAYSHLKESNKALMRGTSFTPEYFKGMNEREVNQFLTNWYKQQDKEPQKPEPEPNTPIIGTPTGSGKPRYFIDQYLNMDPKERTIEFEAPASVVFGKHKNKEEATNKWLDRQ